MLEVEELSVAVDSRQIIHDISFNVDIGETLVLFGPNGGGKSTLGARHPLPAPPGGAWREDEGHGEGLPRR
jgi:ABC-type molybdenum transport system ATPase subunit/photorepair protein PhrA